MTDQTHAVQLVKNTQVEFENALSLLDIGSEPALLYDPAKYILSSGGKRLRPVLLLLTAKAFGASIPAAMPAALAVEIFHNFTLVHDDIMDRADTRRGRATIHKKWDEATAILSGDYLMALSYELLSELPSDQLPEVYQAFQKMVRALCEGQAMDKAFEVRRDVTLDEYFEMIQRKTGALIQAVFEIGAIIGGASERERHQLSQAGYHIGRAFQIQDDLLDLTAENHKWGKKVGGDLIEGKKAYLLLKALSNASGDQLAFFQDVVSNDGLDERHIPLARQYMEECGVFNDAASEVITHTNQAMSSLEVLPEGENKLAIIWLFQRMQQRVH